MSSLWTIRRSASDAKLAGVCGGVAQHWNVDPVLVRVGWILLALSAGIGLVLYVAGWLLVPVEGKDKAVIHDLLGSQADRISREVWIAIVVVACVIGLVVFGGLSPFGFAPALVLALIWYFGYYRTKVRRTPPPPPASPEHPAAVPPPAPTQFYSYSGPPTAFTRAADAWRDRIIEVQRNTTATGQPGAGGTAAGPPVAPMTTASRPQPSTLGVPPRPWSAEPVEDRSEPSGWAQAPDAADQQAFLAHPDPVGLYAPTSAPVPVVIKGADRLSARRLRLAGLVAVGLTLAGLGIADTAGLPVPAIAYLAGALLVIGLVLIAATWWGRARGILPIGVVLALITAAVAGVPQVPAPADWQPHQVATYTSAAQFPAGGDRFDVGSADVDLGRLALTKDTTYTASLDLGNLSVTVPPDVNVVVDYTISAGELEVFGVQKDSGTDKQGVVAIGPTDPDHHTLTLKLTADVGQIEVNR